MDGIARRKENLIQELAMLEAEERRQARGDAEGEDSDQVLPTVSDDRPDAGSSKPRKKSATFDEPQLARQQMLEHQSKLQAMKTRTQELKDEQLAMLGKLGQRGISKKQKEDYQQSRENLQIQLEVHEKKVAKQARITEEAEQYFLHHRSKGTADFRGSSPSRGLPASFSQRGISPGFSRSVGAASPLSGAAGSPNGAGSPQDNNHAVLRSSGSFTEPRGGQAPPRLVPSSGSFTRKGANPGLLKAPSLRSPNTGQVSAGSNSPRSRQSRQTAFRAS